MKTETIVINSELNSLDVARRIVSIARLWAHEAWPGNPQIGALTLCPYRSGYIREMFAIIDPFR